MADLTLTVANVRIGGRVGVKVVQAGETLAEGDVLYKSGGKYYKAIADDVPGSGAKANGAA